MPECFIGTVERERLQIPCLDSIHEEMEAWPCSSGSPIDPLLIKYVHQGTIRERTASGALVWLVPGFVVAHSNPCLFFFCSSVCACCLSVHPSAQFVCTSSSVSPLMLDSVALTLLSDSASAALVPFQVASPPRRLYVWIHFPASWKLLVSLTP